MSKLLTAPAIPQEHLGVCDPEFCVLPFYTLILSVASPWGHIRCDGDTLSPHQYLHSPQTLYSFPAVALVLGSPSSSPTVLCSWASPSAQNPLPVQISPLGISIHKLCWLIQGLPHLLLLLPFVFQSWGFHSLSGWFAVTPYSHSSCNNGSPWWHWIPDLSLVQGHNFYHFAQW